MRRTWPLALGLSLLLPAVARADAPVSITSEPPGAALSLDGHDVGTTPFHGELPTGPHTATARLAGHFPAALRFELGGTGTTLSLTLVAEPAGDEAEAPHETAPEPAPPAPRGRSLLDALGPLVLAAAGLAFVVIDFGALGSVGLSADGSTRTELDPAPFATYLVLAGAAFVGALVWWLIGERRADGAGGVSPENGQAGAAGVI